MTYGEFLRTIRKYCVNRKISNESLVNEPIEGLIKFSRIRKQKGSETGELLYYEITESSRIINNKLDVSPRLRDALEKTEAEEAAKEGFIRFYKNHIDNNVLKDMIENFIDLIDEDKSFKKSELSAIKVTKDTPEVFLAKIFIKSLKECNYIENVDESIIWRKGNSYVRIIKGDIFTYLFGKRKKDNRIVVIPVNTGFDTHVSTKLEKENNPAVSAITLHGKLLMRLYKNGIAEDVLNSRIRQNLKTNKLISGKEKNISCSIGSIAVLDYDPATLYLLAVSEFDKENKAHSSKKNIKAALEKLLNYYDGKGMGYDIYLPLIGTGLSRAYCDNQESLDLILDVLKTNVSHLQGRINIVILPEVIKELEIRKEL